MTGKSLSGKTTVNMKLYKLNRTVLSIKNNSSQFLNGLTSNNLDASRNAFLNIHGRIIAVFDQIKINDNEFWVIVETPFVEGLLQHLERYRQLSKSEIEKLNTHVYFDLDSETASASDALVVIPQKAGNLIISDGEMESTVSEKEFTFFRLKIGRVHV